MPVMEVVLQQTYQQQQIINRWNYVAAGTPAAVTFSFALTNALGAVAVAGVYPATLLMRLIAAVQNTAVAFDLLTVRNVFSTTDFYSLPFIEPLQGQDAGEGMAPFVSYGARTNRVRSDVRRATKRFVGVTETRVGAGGNLVTAWQTTTLQALIAEMTEVLTYNDEGNTLTFTPAVCAKERYNPDTGLADPNGRAYRYFATEALQLAKTATGILWDSYSQVRSQASRQIGHGR